MYYSVWKGIRVSLGIQFFKSTPPLVPYPTLINTSPIPHTVTHSLNLQLSLSLSHSVFVCLKTTMASTSMEVEKKVKKMIKLRSSDGDTFEVEENVAMESRKIKNNMMIQEDNCAGETVIPLPIIPSNILARVIEYCKKHVSESHGESLTAWDAKFVNLDNNTFYELCVVRTPYPSLSLVLPFVLLFSLTVLCFLGCYAIFVLLDGVLFYEITINSLLGFCLDAENKRG